MLLSALLTQTVTGLCLRGCLCSLRGGSRLPPTVATGLPAVTVDSEGNDALVRQEGHHGGMSVGTRETQAITRSGSFARPLAGVVGDPVATSNTTQQFGQEAMNE